MAIRSLSTSTLTQQTRWATMSVGAYEPPYTCTYLVHGGGAGGNDGVSSAFYGSGGAAGVARTDTITLSEGTYVVTVGAGSPGTKGSVSAGESSVFPEAATGGLAHANDGEGGDNDDFVGGARSGVQSGGGAGAGANGSGTTGGAGYASSITGSSVTRGGGGAGNTSGTAGSGGGGTWSGGNGTANTGSGGAGNTVGDNGGNGGSGVVYIRLPNFATLTKGASHTMNTIADGEFTVYEFTAGDDNITIA